MLRVSLLLISAFFSKQSLKINKDFNEIPNVLTRLLKNLRGLVELLALQSFGAAEGAAQTASTTYCVDRQVTLKSRLKF